MTATAALTINDEFGAVIVGVIALITVLIVAALVVAIRTMDALRRNIEDLRQGPIPSGGDQYVVFHQGGVPTSVAYPMALQSNAPALERGNDPLWSDRPMTAGIEAASRLAYLTFASPVIKTIALGSGTVRALRSFRRS